MALRSLFFIATAVMALLNVGFASDDNDMPLAYSNVEPYETPGQFAKKSLRGHNSRTGFAGIEDWRDCLLDPETEMAKSMLEVEWDIRTALNAFRTATTEELLADLAKACIQATMYGSPRGATALVIIADYMEGNGKPSVFLDLYTQLTQAVCKQPINVQTIMGKLQELPPGTNTDERLLHMGVLGNTVASDCFWQRVTHKEEWLKPWSELDEPRNTTIQKLSRFGSKTFQGLLAHDVYQDPSLDSAEKIDRLDAQMVNDFTPAADYLFSLYIAEIDASPEAMDKEEEWRELIKLSDSSPYGRRVLADMLTEKDQRKATPAFMQAMTWAADLQSSDKITPYQILRELARSRKQDDWYIKAALYVTSDEDEWSNAPLDYRWETLRLITKENPIVKDVAVQALNARDEKSSMGRSKDTPKRRFRLLQEMVDDGNARAAELYEQIAFSALGISEADLSQHFKSSKTSKEWIDVIERRALEAGSRSAQEFMLGRRGPADRDLWQHLFEITTVMNSANDGASTRFDMLVRDAR